MSDQNNQVSDFSWIKFYEELADKLDKLLEYKDITANFLPPRIINSKLLQYPKVKVI